MDGDNFSLVPATRKSWVGLERRQGILEAPVGAPRSMFARLPLWDDRGCLEQND